jgi:antitoxin PrlF
MIISKLTTKAQTTIPQAVRTALHLRPGDQVAYVIEDGRVIMTRVEERAQADDPFATFGEWGSKTDCEGYRDL